MINGTYCEVTEANIADVRERVSTCDQKDPLVPGAKTWGIYYQPGNQRGQMTILPNGDGMVDYGADSLWGVWDEAENCLILQCGCRIDEDGENCDTCEEHTEEGGDED